MLLFHLPQYFCILSRMLYRACQKKIPPGFCSGISGMGWVVVGYFVREFFVYFSWSAVLGLKQYCGGLEILGSQIFTQFCNLPNVQSINMLLFWDCLIELSEELYTPIHSYKIIAVQKLNECDMENRMISCEDIFKNIPGNAVLLASNNAHFHLSGCVYKQNFRYWIERNSQQFY